MVDNDFDILDQDGLLDLLDNPEPVRQEAAPKEPAKEQNEYHRYNNNSGGNWKNRQQGGNQAPSLWNRKDIQPVKVDPSKFQQNRPLTFTIAVPSGLTLPEDARKKLMGIATFLCKKGFTYRSGAGDKDMFQMSILNLDGVTSEVYLPWKKFNLEIDNPTMASPEEIAYATAVGLHSKFYDMKESVRAILAKDVHVILGKRCVVPITMLIVYTPNGEEGITKKMEYKGLGSIPFFFKITEAAGIPTFNISKDDAMSRMDMFIKDLLSPKASDNFNE